MPVAPVDVGRVDGDAARAPVVGQGDEASIRPRAVQVRATNRVGELGRRGVSGEAQGDGENRARYGRRLSEAVSGPSHFFSSARLGVIPFGRGDLELAKTNKVKGASKRAGTADKVVRLPIKPKRRTEKKLKQEGKAKVRAKVTFTPDGGRPNTLSKRVKLVKR